MANYKKIVFTLLMGVLLGGLLMILVFLIPTDTIEKRVRRGIEVLSEEGISGYVLINSSGTKLDNYTDAIMLGGAAFQKESANIFEKTVMVYHPKGENLDPYNSTIAYYVRGEEVEAESYSRYWHGYMVILKPLLLFFEYQQIRILNIILQSFLVISVIYLLVIHKLFQLIIPFIIGIICLYPPVIPLSLQYSSIFYIVIISVNVLLFKFNFIQEKIGFSIFFLIVGMTTSYFDFLTYPLLTLGIPLSIIVFQMNEKEYMIRIKYILVLSFVWGLGYIMMWVGKWILGSILLQQNLFRDAFIAIIERAGQKQDQEIITYISVIRRNLSVYVNRYGMSAIGLILIPVIWEVRKKSITIFKKINLIYLVPWILLISMPFVWYLVTRNHSYIHFGFTYRILVVAIFAGQCMLLEICERGKDYIKL